MPKLKPGTIFPTAEEAAAIHAAALSDPDNPPLDEAFFHNARPAREVLPPALYAALTDNSRPVAIHHVTDAEHASWRRGGRPKSSAPKQSTTIRLDADVMGAFKATGAGWQTRINALLREAVQAGRV